MAHFFVDGAQQQTTWIAGPAKAGDKVPAGRIAAAFASPKDGTKVAYATDDGGLWFAWEAGGKWQRQAIEAVGPGVVGESLALTSWQGQTAIVFDHKLDGRVGFVVTDGEKSTVDWIEAPSGQGLPTDSKVDLGGRLSVSAFESKIAVAAYDRTGGDLWIATRTDSSWTTHIVAGRDTATGEDTSDAGSPAMMTRGLGGELVVAYRDATANAVRVARSQGGHTQHTLVTDGTYVDSTLGVTRTRLVGGDLAIATLPTGRSAVAFQDGSRLRVGLALQTTSGKYDVLMAPYSKRPQIAPRVVAKLDGSALVSWLQLDLEAAVPVGLVTHWSVGGVAR